MHVCERINYVSFNNYPKFILFDYCAVINAGPMLDCKEKKVDFIS